MKLLIINYMALPLPPVKGGAVEYLVDSFLKDNEEKQLHDITTYSVYDEKAQLESKRYKHTKFKFIRVSSLFDKIDKVIRHFINKFPDVYIGNTYISKILKQEKNLNQYDAIIIENAPEFVLKIPRSFKNKLILHLHNDYLNSNSKKAKEIFDRFDEIYTISNSLGECVKTIEKTDKVKTLYNGIDLKRFSANHDMRSAMRQKYNIADDDFVFMYSGRIVPDKGVRELAEAFGKINNPKVKLLIVGGIRYSNQNTDSYRESVKALAGENAVFTGFVPYEEMPLLYSISDVGVIPSICNDAFNLSVIEFCTNGIPLIISDRGAMKELVNEKCSVIAGCNTEFVQNIYNALKFMLDNRSGLTKMGIEAKKISENFGIDKYCDRFNELLKELTNKENE